jgi:Leucine-rich repeat (LRR) protein
MLPPDIMQLVCTALQSATLQALDLTNCGLTDDAADSLSLLAKSTTALTELHLSGNRLSPSITMPIHDTVAVNAFVEDMFQGLLICPHELQIGKLSSLNSASRIKILAEVILAKKL